VTPAASGERGGLLKLAKEYVFAKNVAGLEKAREFKKSAEQYWQFCVAFEFPKVYDQEAMEKAAEHLTKVIPCEHLKALIESATGRKRTRSHYALGKRGPEELSFVRQQDLNIAMEL
jgi:hypothetical protein